MLLTIREAANQTGHSTHKIRRLIRAIADKPKHADRSHVEPSAADVQRLNTEGVQFTWRISEEIVRRQLGDAPVAAAKGKPESGAGESAGTLSLLERAIAAHEKAAAQLFEQLKVKDDQISALNERLRESNLLMASLQKQLPEAGKNPVGVLDAATLAGSKAKGKGTPPAGKKKHRSWLRRLLA